MPTVPRSNGDTRPLLHAGVQPLHRLSALFLLELQPIPFLLYCSKQTEAFSLFCSSTTEMEVGSSCCLSAQIENDKHRHTCFELLFDVPSTTTEWSSSPAAGALAITACSWPQVGLILAASLASALLASPTLLGSALL